MNVHDEEKMKLDEQASQVARGAAEVSRQLRMIRSRESISVPTWTGRSGTAGAPGSSSGRKFGSTVNSRLITKSRTGVGSSNSERLVAGTSSGKALSSSELLAKIRATQQQAVGDAMEHQWDAGSSSSGRTQSSRKLGGVQPEVLISQICAFVQQRDGISDFVSIVQHFKDKIPSKDLPVFKSLLKEITTVQKTPNGSSWILKPEYR